MLCLTFTLLHISDTKQRLSRHYLILMCLDSRWKLCQGKRDTQPFFWQNVSGFIWIRTEVCSISNIHQCGESNEQQTGQMVHSKLHQRDEMEKKKWLILLSLFLHLLRTSTHYKYNKNPGHYFTKRSHLTYNKSINAQIRKIDMATKSKIRPIADTNCCKVLHICLFLTIVTVVTTEFELRFINNGAKWIGFYVRWMKKKKKKI